MIHTAAYRHFVRKEKGAWSLELQMKYGIREKYMIQNFQEIPFFPSALFSLLCRKLAIALIVLLLSVSCTGKREKAG